MTRLFARAAGTLILSFLLLTPAAARTIIRDSEIETYLARLSRPIFEAAGLDPALVHLYMVRDPRLNAFVAGGQNIFLHTGLLMRTETPEQLAGVIAHETGHIAGGHLARIGRAAEQATVEALLGAVLGAAAAAAGSPEAGTALILGGQTLAQRSFLKFTRTQESAADHAAVSYLEAGGMSPRGLLDFLRILERSGFGLTVEGAEYLRTHPLTRERIRALEAVVARSPTRDARLPAEMYRAHARMVAKLEGFLEKPERVLDKRKGRRFEDRYARAVALFRIGRTDDAVKLVRDLLAAEPQNPYLWELLGQIQFESGRVEEAEGPYRRAVELAPNAALLRFGLARVLAEMGDPARLEEARRLLRAVLREDQRNAGASRLLGVVEGRLGHRGESFLRLAEWAVLTKRKREADLYIERARAALPPGDPRRLRLEDLAREAARLEDRRGRRRKRR